MNIKILDDFELTESEKREVETRLRLSLSRYSTRIAKLTVRFSAPDIPGEGVRRCRLEVVMHPPRTIVVEEEDENLQRLADHAGQQMARTVERKIRREFE